MPGNSNYPGGFAGGVTIQGLPVVVTPGGANFYVYNGTALNPGQKNGSNGNKGTFNAPFATLDFAISQCVANRGDTIFVKAGHIETISTATALNLAVAGVSIVGQGTGSNRPTFTLDTANTVTVPVTANNILLQNIVFRANFLNIVSLFTLTSALRFTLDQCEFRDLSAILNFATIVTTGTTDSSANGLTITSCQWYGLGTATNTSAIKMNCTHRVLNFYNNYVTHAAVTAAGFMPIATGKVVTDMVCVENAFMLVGATTTTTGILITTDGTTNSGIIAGNMIQTLDVTTEILVTALSGFRFFNNWYSGVADKSGYLLPAADA